MKSKILSALLTVCMTVISAQVMVGQIVSTSPLFPTRHSHVTVTYDATQGNGALAGVNPIYAHTGLITDNSGSAPAIWQYTQDNWGTADAYVQMTSIGNNKYTISFNIDSFYGDYSGDTIYKMAFVFRNTDGTIVGRDLLGNDMYLNVYNDSLHCALIHPGVGSVIPATINSTMNFFGAASQNCNMTLYANGNELAQVTNDSLTYSNFTFLNSGVYHILLRATTGIQTTVDSMDIYVNPAVNQQNPPAGIVEGINYLTDSSVILCLLAPGKSFVYAIGDFNNWQTEPSHFMNKSLNGELWWTEVDHLTPLKKYVFQYDVDGSIRIGDPYSDEVSDQGADQYITANVYPNLPVYPVGKTNGIGSVIQTAQVPYTWHDTTYQRPDKHNLVIYELLVRDFQSQNNYIKLTDSLDYLQKLGINAIELLPIMNFEGTSSWGYDPNYFQAPEKSYGPKNTLKDFINACHSKGIAVLFDIAFNDAFASCPMAMLYWDSVNQYPASNNPWFNQVAPHPYSVGYDFNHNSTYTQNYLDRTLAYWIKQYHADGFRFDLAKGYTQTYSGGDVGLWGDYDTMRIRLIERMADHVWNTVDSSSILILEYFANSNSGEAIELQAHNKGLMMWEYDLNPAYNQCTMGYTTSSDVSNISYQYDGWSNANMVGFMESHDEQRLMYNNELYGDSVTGYCGKCLDTALARMELMGTLFFPVPGPKMLWMFGERGYDVPIDYNGRINPKPAHWEYLQNQNRLHLFKVWSALIKLKLNYAPFTTTNYNVNMGGVVKNIWLSHALFNVCIIGNFDVGNQTGTPYFQHTGWWYDYFTGDSMNVTNASMTLNLKAGEYHLFTDKSLPVPDLSPPAYNGIDEIAYSKDMITVYPMPTAGLVHFESDDAQPIQKIAIYDIEGRKVFEQQYDGNEKEISISLPGNLNSGMYIYNVAVNNMLHSGKLIYSK